MFSTGRFKSPPPGSKTLPPLESGPAREVGPRYEWVDVGMLEYNPDTKQYLVKRAFVPSHILEKNNNNKKVEGKSGGGSDGEGRSDGSSSSVDDESSSQRPVSAQSSGKLSKSAGKKKRKKGEKESSDGIHYWVPRVRLMFAAEDPSVFADRVAQSYHLRHKTEALLRYIMQMLEYCVGTMWVCAVGTICMLTACLEMVCRRLIKVL